MNISIVFFILMLVCVGGSLAVLITCVKRKFIGSSIVMSLCLIASLFISVVMWKWKDDKTLWAKPTIEDVRSGEAHIDTVEIYRWNRTLEDKFVKK